MYTRLTRSRTRAELASPTYVGLEIIKIIILQCIYVSRSRIHVELASATYLGLGII